MKSIILFPDGNHVALGSFDNIKCIRIIRQSANLLKGEYWRMIYSTVFFPDDSCGSFDNTMHIWSASMNNFTTMEHVALSPDGSCYVYGSGNSVHIYNVVTGKSEAKLKGNLGWEYSAVFSPDGCRVVSGSNDNTVHIWNVATGESEAELRGHLGKVNSFAFSPDGSHVVSGSADNTICIWNIATGTSSVLPDRALLQECVHHHPQEFNISTTSFKPDSPCIVHTRSGLQCWLPPQYRNIQSITSHTTMFSIGLKSGLVLVVKICSDPFNAVLT